MDYKRYILFLKWPVARKNVFTYNSSGFLGVDFIQYLTNPVSIAPLVIFRILFGGVLFAATLRFVLKGWIEKFYVSTHFHFTYFGFEWVEAPDCTSAQSRSAARAKLIPYKQ